MTADAISLELATPLMDTDIRWDLDQSSPWPTTDVLVAASLRALPSIEDDLAARLILELLHAITTLQTQVAAHRAVIAVGLDEWHGHARAEYRLERRRQARRKAAKQAPR